MKSTLLIIGFIFTVIIAVIIYYFINRNTKERFQSQLNTINWYDEEIVNEVLTDDIEKVFGKSDVIIKVENIIDNKGGYIFVGNINQKAKLYTDAYLTQARQFKITKRNKPLILK